MNKLVLDLSPKPTCFLSFPFTAEGLASKPTLLELLYLKPSSGRSVRVVQEIGTHYSTLGLLLLNDDTGAVTSSIIDKHHHESTQINQEILTRWLQGQGKKPVAWSTLIDVLRAIDLSELAQAIQEALTSSAQSFGETITH